MRKVIAWTLAIPMAIRNGVDLLKIVFGPDAVPGDFATRGGAILGLRPSSFYNTSSDAVAVMEELQIMMGRYRELTLPLAILFAKDDLILDYRVQGEAMKQQCPALNLVLLKGHGHMLQLIASEETADLVRQVSARQAGS
jgi:pimeloyl-ACP methyl ester carboxylesterase